MAENEAKVTGIELIAAERKRQVEVEGWTPEHDAEHTNGELAKAAACYAAGTSVYQENRRFLFGDVRLPHITFENLWPWKNAWYKPKDRVSDLVRAGALIAAEIDRISAQDSHSVEKPRSMGSEVWYRIYYDENGITWYSDPIMDMDNAREYRRAYADNPKHSNVRLVEETTTRKVID